MKVTKLNDLKIIFSLILAGVLLLSCTEKSPAKDNRAEKLTEEGVFEMPNYDCDKSVKGLNLFWEKFRAAMLKEDMTTLATMTEFPLRIVGPSDVHRTSISRQEFAKYFPYLLNAPMKTLYRVTESKHPSMKELARNLTTLSAKQCGDIEGQLNIEEWTFIMRNEGWRLVAVGVYEFNPSKE